MNRRDLMESTLKSAYESARKVAEEYTCPHCCNTHLWDPVLKSCESCLFTIHPLVPEKPVSWFKKIIMRFKKYF